MEDHPALRETLCMFFEAEDDLEVCGAAGSGMQALEALDHCQPAIALVDLSLPDMSGIQFIQSMRKNQPNVRCLVHSSRSETAFVERAVAAGADGYVLKGRTHELTSALRRVATGERVLSPGLKRY